jgi:hypothetical protein
MMAGMPSITDTDPFLIEHAAPLARQDQPGKTMTAKSSKPFTYLHHFV